jgi:3D-(3,5/4)-trihydroxycyclohexane-1,2-dione acylhydrolase (decyclizing)
MRFSKDRNADPVRISVGAALVRFLQVQYVRRDGREHRLINGICGIFGHGNVTGLGQALEEHGGRALPYHQPKNEQAMVHTAIAYAKTKRRLGTLACTSPVGPGATNMVTGAATATVNRLPVLLLPGDIFANRRPAPVLQQLEHPGSQDTSVNDCFKPVSRYWDRINRPEQILTAMPEAMRVLADSAETGAVTIALPEDVQAEAFDCPVHFFAKRVYEVARPAPGAEQLRAAAALLRTAKRPLLIAGGGVHYSDACAAIQKFAEATGIPVAVTQAGKGALLESHALGLGGVGVTGTLAANRIALTADVVLCLGTRLSDFTTASKTQFQDPHVRFVAVNVNSADAAKHGALPARGRCARDAGRPRSHAPRLAGVGGPGPCRRQGEGRLGKTVARHDLTRPAQPGRFALPERGDRRAERVHRRAQHGRARFWRHSRRPPQTLARQIIDRLPFRIWLLVHGI